MERGRSFSGGWNSSTRPRPPRIATVKPVSKSFSEDDLMKVIDDKQNISPRVFSRLKIQDLALLKKDNLISELEKCLGELEEEHDTTNHLAEVYEKVENERNQLLNELDIAFQDLQEYMQKQKDMEEQATSIETEREELYRENEYLKAVLSNRTEIRDNKMEEENRTLHERVKELEQKNTQLLDEINDLYEDRQTLISSLLNLRSEEVDEVIKRRSRNSSIASRDSTTEGERLRSVSEEFDEQMKELEDVFEENLEIHETCKKVFNDMKSERQELQEAFKRVKKERDETEKELDSLREDKEQLSKSFGEKVKELEQVAMDRNEKNLNLSELKLEKRTLQRQLDHMRETNRSLAGKVTNLKEENTDLSASLSAMANQLATEDVENDQLEALRAQLNQLKKQLEDAGITPVIDNNDNSDGLDQTDRSSVREAEGAKLEALETQKAQLESEKNELLTELKTLKESLDRLNVGKTEIEKQLQTMSQKCKDVSRERDALRNSYKQSSDKNADLESENVRFKRESIKLRNDISVLDKQMKNRINTLEIEISKLASTKDTIEKNLRRKEEEEKDLKHTIKDLEQQLREKEEVEPVEDILSNATNEVLLAANQKYEVLQQENEKTQLRNKQLEKMTTDYRSEIKQLKEIKDALHQRNRTLEAESTNVSNNLNTLKIENERFVKKNRQLEKSVNENISLQTEVKQLKDANEVLLKRYRVLENESNTISNNYDNLKLENDRLSKQGELAEKSSKELSALKEQLKKLNDTIANLQLRNKTLESELNAANISKSKEDERERYSMLLVKHDNLCQQFESINTQLQTTHSTLEEKCEKLKIVLKENERLKHKLNEIPLDEESREGLQTQLEEKVASLTKELETLKQNKEMMARDVQYILQSRREEAETFFTNTKNQIEHERDTIKAKYELLRVDCDKMGKEKEHYLMTIDTLREENGKLHGQVRKQRLISSSTQDLMIQRLRDDNDTLEKQLEVVKNSLAKSITENKNLVHRLSRTDESTVTTMRSLKAHKNELQLQVNALTHENEHLKKKLHEKREEEKSGGGKQAETPDVKRKYIQLERTEADLKDKLLNTQSKVADLEADNRDYVKKLKESEGLMYELQQALAQANDLAMQKSLEATKTRRQLEKKADRLVQENTELKRKVYFTGKSDGEISPTSLFPRSASNSLTRGTGDAFRSRKVSLPASIQSETESGKSTRRNTLKSTQSFEFPMLDPTFESKLQIGSPNITASQQVELDLSQQLRELLDLTNDLTTVKENDVNYNGSQESMAPPVPPPPVNYETLDRKKSLMTENLDSDSASDKKDEDWV